MAESSVVTEAVSSADKPAMKTNEPDHKDQDDTKAGGQIDAAATEQGTNAFGQIDSGAPSSAPPPPPPQNFYPPPPLPPPMPILDVWIANGPFREPEESMSDYL
jgi:hypothetical protein